jgi:hypothetical protein
MSENIDFYHIIYPMVGWTNTWRVYSNVGNHKGLTDPQGAEIHLVVQSENIKISYSPPPYKNQWHIE